MFEGQSSQTHQRSSFPATMRTTMTPLFFLAATALLPYGCDAFVVLPAATSARARGGNLSKNMANAPITAETVQEREDARAALAESGGVDELMKMLSELRNDGSEGEEEAPAAPAATAVAAPPSPAKVRRWV